MVINGDLTNGDFMVISMVISWISMGFIGDLMEIPSGYVKIAIENGHRKWIFPINSMVMLHSYVKLPEGT